MSDNQIETLESLYQTFAYRYNPKILIESGAAPEKVYHPYFSAFSSQLAFLRLQKLFDNHVYYVWTPYDEQKMYLQVKKLAQRKGLNRYSIATTNIVDLMPAFADPYAYRTNKNLGGESKKRYLHFVRNTFSSLANPDPEITVESIQTRRLNPPHGFEKIVVKSGTDLDSVIPDTEFRRRAVPEGAAEKLPNDTSAGIVTENIQLQPITILDVSEAHFMQFIDALSDFASGP